MAAMKPCFDYRTHMDPQPWRVTAGKLDGSTSHCSAWTCDRHLTSTVIWAREFTGLDPIIVPRRNLLPVLRAELDKLPADWQVPS
jgi:hypothetical protein